jgi:magnesium-transporting ATPase (P-type)
MPACSSLLPESGRLLMLHSRMDNGSRSNSRSFGALIAAAGYGTAIIVVWLFAGWFMSFVIMRFVGTYLLVGMCFLAWPVVFPIFAAPPSFLALACTIPLFPGHYRGVLGNRRFILFVFLPLVLASLLIMLATCPLDIGGSFLSRGWKAFG